jgi:hypothetical protein
LTEKCEYHSEKLKNNAAKIKENCGKMDKKPLDLFFESKNSAKKNTTSQGM